MRKVPYSKETLLIKALTPVHSFEIVRRMALSQKKWFVALSAILFTLAHYTLAIGIFFLMASYASDIDGVNPVLTHLQEKILTGAFYIILLPFGFLPFGVLINSPIVGYGFYRLLSWKFLPKKVSTT